MLAPHSERSASLLALFGEIHDALRSRFALQPPEALDELLEIAGAALERRPPNPAHASLSDAAQWSLRLAGAGLATATGDVRGAAFNAFVHRNFRRGLGIYLTPEPVVDAAVAYVAPSPSQRVCDPACGSGSFLLKVAQTWAASDEAPTGTLVANDASPRMLRIARLNLGGHAGIACAFSSHDAFAPGAIAPPCDAVLSNPPFGIRLKEEGPDPGLAAMPELLFVVRALQMLVPGGRLAVVLPNGVLRARRAGAAYAAAARLGYVEAVLAFPPETFAITGTAANVSLVFLRRYGPQAGPQTAVAVRSARATNVGYDATGRSRTGSDVSEAVEALRRGGAPAAERQLAASQTFEILSRPQPAAAAKPRRGSAKSTVALGDLLELAVTGATPPRDRYRDAGAFIVKVGNLTGSGIDWTPRERNFVDAAWLASRGVPALRPGDVLLTASAHSPVYIAKKIDVVPELPPELGPQVTFVGEVMLLRCLGTIDPYALAACLRHPHLVAQLQSLVRGQTAHLRPADVRGVRVARETLARATTVAALLREEAELREKHAAARRKASEAIARLSL